MNSPPSLTFVWLVHLNIVDAICTRWWEAGHWLMTLGESGDYPRHCRSWTTRPPHTATPTSPAGGGYNSRTALWGTVQSSNMLLVSFRKLIITIYTVGVAVTFYPRARETVCVCVCEVCECV